MRNKSRNLVTMSVEDVSIAGLDWKRLDGRGAIWHN